MVYLIEFTNAFGPFAPGRRIRASNEQLKPVPRTAFTVLGTCVNGEGPDEAAAQLAAPETPAAAAEAPAGKVKKSKEPAAV